MAQQQKIVDFSAYKSDDTYKKLFAIWFYRLPELYQRNLKRPIPFLISTLTLSNSKITKREAKTLLKTFVKQGWLETVQFKGYRLTVKAIKEILNDMTVFEFLNNFGIDVVNSRTFAQAVYEKAQEDTEFWLKHAPHGLRRDKNG
jgi:hypothetical protein